MRAIKIALLLLGLLTFAPGAVAQEPTLTPPVATVPAVVASPAAQQNTITTTAPVSSTTTISVGTLASQLLNWVMLAFSGPIGAMVVWILVRVLKKLGIDASDALRARLQEMVVNGLNLGAARIEKNIEGKGKIEIKNEIAQSAVAYVQAHGAETIKALGLDPQSGAAVEAIKARIETAIADPLIPTPAVMSPDAAPKLGVPAATIQPEKRP